MIMSVSARLCSIDVQCGGQSAWESHQRYTLLDMSSPIVAIISTRNRFSGHGPLCRSLFERVLSQFTSRDTGKPIRLFTKDTPLSLARLYPENQVMESGHGIKPWRYAKQGYHTRGSDDSWQFSRSKKRIQINVVDHPCACDQADRVEVRVAP